MNELDTMRDFPILEDDDGLDIAAIFGDVPSEPPPGEAAKEAALPSDVPNLFGEMTPKPAEQAPKQTASQAKKSLFDKPPVFSYGGAKEEIADASMTFEELRIQKADDFPELDEGKSVSWRVRYGTAAKSISDPKGTTILQTKQEIERSKAFLDSLKKGKDKDPVCLVTPSVTAKSKGIAAYKGMFPSLETARASDKVICLIPARDGQVYELRKHELGEFIAPKHNITELSEIRAGFRPALPLIPGELLGQIISFFRCFMGEKQEYEALVQIYWDREAEEFIPFVPKQSVSKAGIRANLENNTLPEDRYLHYADVHSHNSMEAKFSRVDDRDERPTGLYIVLGRLNGFYPEISVRISCGGAFQTIDPSLVLEGVGTEFPTEWIDQVTKAANSTRWLDDAADASKGGPAE